jgi:beta-glucanase (GH16 family)
MSWKKLKTLLPLLVLAAMILLIYRESKNYMEQIRPEPVQVQPEENRVSDGERSRSEVMNEYDRYCSDLQKKLARERELKDSRIFWKPINRKDSYNNELQFYSSDNVIIKEDSIGITSRKEERENKAYTSGLVESTNAYRYGYFEFNIEISEGKGIFPAIWMMPDDGSAYPEIDIFEMIGSDPYSFYGVIHYLEDGVKKSKYFRHEVPRKEKYCVSLKWDMDSLTWYIDNREMMVLTNGVPSGLMYIIVNQAVGGDWPGDPEDTAFPCKFKVLSSQIQPVFKKGR